MITRLVTFEDLPREYLACCDSISRANYSHFVKCIIIIILYRKKVIFLYMLSRIVTNTNKKNTIKKVSEWVFSGFSIFFIGMLVFMAVHDTMTSQSSNTAEYCAKYGFLASPGCW